MSESLVGDGNAATVAIYAALMYDIISATNSSPQTTEINAGARASTLMKWVHLGLAQGILFVALGVLIEDKGKRWRPLLGGGIAAVLLYAQYVHAKNSGLSSDEPGTENYVGSPAQQAVSNNGSKDFAYTTDDARELFAA